MKSFHELYYSSATMKMLMYHLKYYSPYRSCHDSFFIKLHFSNFNIYNANGRELRFPRQSSTFERKYIGPQKSRKSIEICLSPLSIFLLICIFSLLLKSSKIPVTMCLLYLQPYSIFIYHQTKNINVNIEQVKLTSAIPFCSFARWHTFVLGKRAAYS